MKISALCNQVLTSHGCASALENLAAKCTLCNFISSRLKCNQVGWSPISSWPHLAKLDSADLRFALGQLGYRSSHLGVHKQTNACWSLPRKGQGFWHPEICKTVSSYLMKKIEEEKNYQTTKFQANSCISKITSVASSSSQEETSCLSNFFLVESQCFTLSFFS